MKYPLVHGTTETPTNPTATQQAAQTLSNDHFAMRLQQNWLSKNPHLEHLTQAAKDPLDDSLTSLNWLQNMNINLGEGTPPISPRNGPIDPNRVNPNQVLPTTLLHRSTSVDSAGRVGLDPAIQFEKVDYKSNPYIKPPYSYASLICMAMKQTRKSKMTLSAIYSWITDNFMYYKMAEPSWQNSIRHNLSLNKCFQKVPRKKDEPGKGGFWRINPEYNALIDASSVKRKTKADLDASLKRLMEELDDGSPRKRSRSTDDDEGNQAALSLSEYLNFDRLLTQDISVDGLKLKTEDIIDGQGNSHGMTLSPPTSDEGSTDSFEDLLNTGLQLDSNEPGPSGLDMTVQGTKIEPPEWWTESFNGASFNGLLSGAIAIDGITHPWSTDKADIDSAIADLSDMEKFLNTSFN